MMSHLMTRNHHLEIEGGMLASASPGVAKNVTGYDARISCDAGKVIHYFLLCKSCFWCASYISYTSNRVKINLADKIRTCPLCMDDSIDPMPLS
jgi:hypothetical protein